MTNYKVFLSDEDVDFILTYLSIKEIELSKLVKDMSKTINSVRKQVLNQVGID